jgi:hypothetical protein
VKAVKFNKTTWIFLGVGAFLVAAFILGWIYLQQLDQQQQMASQFSQKQKTLAAIKFDDLNANKDLYIRQISQYSSQIQDAKSKLSSSANSLDATDDILASAKSYGVKIDEMSSPGLGTENFSGANCQTLGITIKVSGDLYTISNLIPNLSQLFPTGIVNSTKINKDPLTEDYKAQISLIIYNYKGK